jgi:hypothetical protein
MTRLEQQMEWKSRIEAFKASGLNATAWCKLHDLKPHQFNYYLYKDKPQDQLVAPAATRWLSVEIEDSEISLNQTSLLVKVGEATIEVKPGFDPALLCQLVRTLSAC